MNKIINKFLELVSLFTLFPFYYFLILKKKKIIIFDATRIGRFCPQNDLFFSFYAKEIKENKIIVCILTPISNIFLYKIFKKEAKKRNIFCFKFNINFFHDLFFKTINNSYKILSKEDLVFYVNTSIDVRQFSGIDSKKKIFHVKKDKKAELRFGINNNKWICVHNRDSEYLKKNAKGDFSYHNHKDFKAKNLLEACEWLTKKGYTIMRMGSNSNEKLKTKNKKIIDYVNSNLKNDYYDIYFLSRCEFYLGSTSGIATVPLIFRRNCFFINVCPFESHFSYRRKNPAIFKKYKKNKKYLGVKKILDSGLYNINHNFLFRKKRIKIEDNSSKEILDFAKESLLRTRGKWKRKKDYIKKKKKMENIFKKQDETKNSEYRNLIGYNFLKKINL